VDETDQAEDLQAGAISIDTDIAVVDIDLPNSHNLRLTLLFLTYRDWDSYLIMSRAAGARGKKNISWFLPSGIDYV
jgi:hypothetical protein